MEGKQALGSIAAAAESRRSTVSSESSQSCCTVAGLLFCAGEAVCCPPGAGYPSLQISPSTAPCRWLAGKTAKPGLPTSFWVFSFTCRAVGVANGLFSTNVGMQSCSAKPAAPHSACCPPPVSSAAAPAARWRLAAALLCCVNTGQQAAVHQVPQHYRPAPPNAAHRLPPTSVRVPLKKGIEWVTAPAVQGDSC